jgi:hypothetical protein
MASAAFTPGPTYADGDTFTYATQGLWLTDQKVGARLEERKLIAAPGQDGYGTKWYGRRERLIQLTVTYNEDSEDNAIEEFLDDLDDINEDFVFSLVLNGRTYSACVLDEKNCFIVQPKWIPDSNLYTAEGTISLIVVRE